MKKFFSLTFLIFSITVCFSQIPVPFKVRYQSYVNGDMTIIANNISNRVDSNSANVPYTSRTNMHKLNDEFMMGYIDIDNDPITFSSSSAELNIENSSTKKIIYAGLYWSATYLCKSSHMVKETEFIIDDPKRESFNEIKIKLPNQENYLDIKGEVIFDGLNVKKFKESAPYAVYADITKEVLKLKNPFGNYTVANIKATTGTISGGVAAGWTLFFIYEDTQMKGKFITSFDGFAGVSDRLVELVFSGFKTLPEGNVEAKIAGSTLEGDYNLKGDQLLFKTTSKNKYLPLSSLLRDESNFFNSSITIGNDYFMNRKPDSKNTLGYDAFMISIPNPDNTVIGNNTKEATIRLKSSGDRSFLFFTAFNVAVTEQEKPILPVEIKQELITTNDSIKKIENLVVANTEIKKTENIANTNQTITPQESKKQEVIDVKTIIPATVIKSEVVKVSEQVGIKNEVLKNNTVTIIDKNSNTIDVTKKPEVIQLKETVAAVESNKPVVTKSPEKIKPSISQTETEKTVVTETNDKSVVLVPISVITENKENTNNIIYNNTQSIVLSAENKTADKTDVKIIPTTVNNTLIVNDSKKIPVTEKITTIVAENKNIVVTENKVPDISETKIIPVSENNKVVVIENKAPVISETKIIPVNEKMTTIVTENKNAVVTENKVPVVVETITIPVTEKITTGEIVNKISPITENNSIKAITNSQVVVETKSVPKAETKNDILTENNATLPITSAIVQTNTETAQAINKENKPEEIFNYNIEGVNKEYYIIANVFAKERNKRNFVKFLKSKGYNADYFYNPIKKYYYVYIDKGIDKDKIQALHDTKINNSYKDDIWVLSINMPKTTEAVVFKETPKEAVKQKETIVNTTIPKESITAEPKAIAAIITTEKPSEIQKAESDLIETKAIVKSTVNKPTERIDAITDENLEDKNTKVALVETDLNSLPSLQTSVTEKESTVVAIAEKQIQKEEINKSTEVVTTIKTEPILVQNNIDIKNAPIETLKVDDKKESNQVVEAKGITEKTNVILVNNNAVIPQTKTLTVQETTVAVTQKSITTPSQSNSNVDVVSSNNKTETKHQFKKEEIANYNFAGLSKGYYIVANVFAKQRNSINFVNALKRKGINAASFYNPIKKYYYVYIEKSNDKAEIEGLYNSKINNSYKDAIWVLSINNPIKQEILVEI